MDFNKIVAQKQSEFRWNKLYVVWPVGKVLIPVHFIEWNKNKKPLKKYLYIVEGLPEVNVPRKCLDFVSTRQV